MSEPQSSDSGVRTRGELPNQCDMPECDNRGDLKAGRDPSNNLLDMCPECRSSWPVEVVSDE